MYYVGLDGLSWDFGFESSVQERKLYRVGFFVVGDYVHPLPLVLNVWHYSHIYLLYSGYLLWDHACFSKGLGSVISAISWSLGAVAGSHNIHGKVT